MKRMRLFVLLALLAGMLPPNLSGAAESLPAVVGADVAASHPTALGELRAGVAKVDSTWHVGASAGQYASDGTPVGSRGVDPAAHSKRREPSYGIQSREWVRALVVEGSDGKRWALVANDLYIPQDLVNRRVAGILEAYDRAIDLGLGSGSKTGIGDDNLTVSVSHSHSSPMYSTPSWGVWAFQDVFDLRFYEHIAQKMAQAVIDASKTLVPVRVGGSVSYFNKLQRHSFGPTLADDGTPAGYPQTDFPEDRTVARTKNENTVTVVRFDDMTNRESPEPLANWVVYGLHPEMLDGNDLLTGEYVNTTYRIADREIGGMTIFSQQNTGTAEPQKDMQGQPAGARAEYSHREYAQVERAARLLTDVVSKTRLDIENGTPEDPDQFSPFAERVTLGVTDMRFAPPSARVVPTVSSCRTEKTFQGNPGVPIAGLPDCEFPFGPATAPVISALPAELRPSVTYEQLRAAGVPIPDNIGAPSYTGLQETLQVHLQAIRIGSIGVTVCPCEQWGDQSRNIRTRLNKIDGDLWNGFDWTQVTRDGTTPFCSQNPNTTWTCADPRVWRWVGDRQVWGDQLLPPISDQKIRRMRAQINNDASGWEDLAYTPQAETEEVDVARIKGNYTHEELTDNGYDLVVPVGMSNDYWGYIATYREFQRGDHYRKALTGLGPHSSDFLATRLTRMAASLNGGASVEYSAKDLAYMPEDVHEFQRAQAIGEASQVLTPLYEATLPANGGTATALAQPSDIERFSAANFSWVGGDNYTDTPHARVERLVNGSWTPFADGSGEVQVKANFPQPEDLPSWRAGQFEWKWQATFEAFSSDIVLPDASGVARRSTPPGTYRFTVEGTRRGLPGETAQYLIESDPFEVKPWSGITVGDLRRDGDGRVSFLLGPTNCFTYAVAGLNCNPTSGPITGYLVGAIDYPDTYASPFDFIRGRNIRDNLKTYSSGRGDDEQFCFECSFRPWLDSSTPESVPITVVSFGGVESTELAYYDVASGRYRGPALLLGQSARIDAGSILDAFGNFNATGAGPISAS